MHITITGKLGSGKSTVCSLFSARYGFETVSTGAIQRECARSLGVTTLELNRMCKTDRSLDDKIDNMTATMSRERPDDLLIFDSRMAWHFVEKSFKVFLTVDPLVAANRVMSNPRGNEERYESVEDACRGLTERSEAEHARFVSMYHADYFLFSNYDLIIDTSKRSPEEVVDVLYTEYARFCQAPAEYRHTEFM